MSKGLGRYRRLALALAGASVIAVGIVGVALAVHDEGFQLEGNATAADLTYVDIDKVGNQTTTTPGTLTGALAGPWDWNSLFTISGTPAVGNALGEVTGNVDPLPSSADRVFTAADFEKDFKHTGTTFLTSDDTTFATGSKDTLPISGWQCNQDNNVNSKTDIINGYAAVQEHTVSPGVVEKILYFGLEKDVDNGDNNVGFWLLQDGTVNCESTGGAVTFTGAHLEGDLFVVSAFTNGGGVAAVTVYQWINDANAQKPGPQPGIDPNPLIVSGDCLDTDPAENATSDRACATVNGKTIRMPWLTADSSVVNADKVSPNFFEGAINLSAFTQFANRCFSDFILNTRSSQELGATLFDFVRGDLDTCRPALGITKTPDSGTYFAGESFSWTIDVTNSGNGAATNAVVTDTIPTGLTIGSPTYDMDPNTAGGTGACSVVGQLVSCTIPTIAASDGNTTGAEPDVARITIPVTVTSAVFGTSTDGCVPVNNTATVTLGSFSASDPGAVTACRLAVVKTASPSFTRTHTWTIDKSVDVNSYSFFDGQNGTSTYTVAVTKTTVDSDWAVSGTITISNPASKAATIGPVTDSMTGGISATVDCQGATSVPATGSIVCTYSSALPNADTRTNTASVTAYTIPYSGSASVNFAGVSPTVVGYDSIDVSDSVEGPLGSTSSSTSFNYDRTFDCSDITFDGGTGSTSYPNTATIDQTGQSDNESVAVTCYRLSVAKDATPTFTRTHTWTIDKSVDVDSHSLFDGQTGTSTYTIAVTKTTVDSAWAVSGNITISNPAPMDATVDSLTDDISGLAGDPTPVCASDTVPAGGSLVCTYSSALPNADTRTNTATASAYGVSYPSNAAAINFAGVSPTVVGYDSIDVSDSVEGPLGSTSSSTSFNYDRTFDCSDITFDGGTGSTSYPNTATIDQTGQSDNESVAVTCYRLSVAKTADTTYDRDYTWTIDKSVDQPEITLPAGQTATVTYSVTVTANPPTDSNFAVSGTITINNPAPMVATIDSITDTITGIGPIAVDCGGATTVAAGGSLLCSYSSALPDGSSRTNNVDVVAYGVTYNADAPITFGDPTTTTDECVDVTDSYAGALGTVCAGDSPHTFTYTRVVGPYATCDDFTITNTASFVTNDTGATGSDSQDVIIHVTGCGNIFHTGTTCDQYLGNEPPVGLAGQELEAINYSVKANKISQVDPGVFFYYTTVTATGSSLTALINQLEPASFNHFMGIQNENQVRVYDADCNVYANFTFTDGNGDATVTINGTTSGADYIISVKYDPKNLVGLTKPATSPVTYTFQTESGGNTFGVDTLDLRRK